MTISTTQAHKNLRLSFTSGALLALLLPSLIAVCGLIGVMDVESCILLIIPVNLVSVWSLELGVAKKAQPSE
jgi:hypothetical protein